MGCLVTSSSIPPSAGLVQLSHLAGQGLPPTWSTHPLGHLLGSVISNAIPMLMAHQLLLSSRPRNPNAHSELPPGYLQSISKSCPKPSPNLPGPLHYRVPCQLVTMPSSSCWGHNPGVLSASSPSPHLPLIYPANSVGSTFTNSGIGPCLASCMITIWPEPRHPSHRPHWLPGRAPCHPQCVVTSTVHCLSPLESSVTRQGSGSLLTEVSPAPSASTRQAHRAIG